MVAFAGGENYRELFWWGENVGLSLCCGLVQDWFSVCVPDLGACDWWGALTLAQSAGTYRCTSTKGKEHPL